MLNYSDELSALKLTLNLQYSSHRHDLPSMSNYFLKLMHTQLKILFYRNSAKYLFVLFRGASSFLTPQLHLSGIGYLFADSSASATCLMCSQRLLLQYVLVSNQQPTTLFLNNLFTENHKNYYKTSKISKSISEDIILFGAISFLVPKLRSLFRYPEHCWQQKKVFLPFLFFLLYSDIDFSNFLLHSGLKQVNVIVFINTLIQNNIG